MKISKNKENDIDISFLLSCSLHPTPTLHTVLRTIPKHQQSLHIQTKTNAISVKTIDFLPTRHIDIHGHRV